MQREDLNGRTIKKECKHLGSSDSVRQRYHNQNKSGGNFGFTVKILKPEEDHTTGPLGNPDKYEWIADVTGRYNNDGEITVLRLGSYGGTSAEIPADLDTLMERLEQHIEENSDYRPKGDE